MAKPGLVGRVSAVREFHAKGCDVLSQENHINAGGSHARYVVLLTGTVCAAFVTARRKKDRTFPELIGQHAWARSVVSAGDVFVPVGQGKGAEQVARAFVASRLNLQVVAGAGMCRGGA